MTSNSAAASASTSSPTFGFADGGKEGVRLFLVNPAAGPCAANDFANSTRAALNKLLDAAVMAGGMDGDTTQLVQCLMGAVDAATGHAVTA
jgi:hypothetical protein